MIVTTEEDVLKPTRGYGTQQPYYYPSPQTDDYHYYSETLDPRHQTIVRWIAFLIFSSLFTYCSLALYVSLRPPGEGVYPHLYLDGVLVPTFNISDSMVKVSWNINLLFENHVVDAVIDYNSLSAQMFYVQTLPDYNRVIGTNAIGNIALTASVPMDSFHQETKSNMTVNLGLTAARSFNNTSPKALVESDSFILNATSAKALAEDWDRGWVNFQLKILLHILFKLQWGFYSTVPIVAIVYCPMNVTAAEGGLLVGGTSLCYSEYSNVS